MVDEMLWWCLLPQNVIDVIVQSTVDSNRYRRQQSNDLSTWGWSYHTIENKQLAKYTTTNKMRYHNHPLAMPRILDLNGIERLKFIDEVHFVTNMLLRFSFQVRLRKKNRRNTKDPQKTRKWLQKLSNNRLRTWDHWFVSYVAVSNNCVHSSQLSQHHPQKRQQETLITRLNTKTPATVVIIEREKNNSRKESSNKCNPIHSKHLE